MHAKVKINIVVCCQFDMHLTCTFPPISKYFDSQGMAASRAAHLPHILRASRQVTVAARQNAACRRVFCALHYITSVSKEISIFPAWSTGNDQAYRARRFGCREIKVPSAPMFF